MVQDTTITSGIVKHVLQQYLIGHWGAMPLFQWGFSIFWRKVFPHSIIDHSGNQGYVSKLKMFYICPVETNMPCLLLFIRFVWLQQWLPLKNFCPTWDSADTTSLWCMPSKYCKSNLRAAIWCSQCSFFRPAARGQMMTKVFYNWPNLPMTTIVCFVFILAPSVLLMLTNLCFYHSFHVILMLYCVLFIKINLIKKCIGV